jgi:hypothetical protein
MTDSLEAVMSLRALVLALIVFGFAPGAVARGFRRI